MVVAASAGPFKAVRCGLRPPGVQSGKVRTFPRPCETFPRPLRDLSDVPQGYRSGGSSSLESGIAAAMPPAAIILARSAGCHRGRHAHTEVNAATSDVWGATLGGGGPLFPAFFPRARCPPLPPLPAGGPPSPAPLPPLAPNFSSRHGTFFFFFWPRNFLIFFPNFYFFFSFSRFSSRRGRAGGAVPVGGAGAGPALPGRPRRDPHHVRAAAAEGQGMGSLAVYLYM